MGFLKEYFWAMIMFSTFLGVFFYVGRIFSPMRMSQVRRERDQEPSRRVSRPHRQGRRLRQDRQVPG